MKRIAIIIMCLTACLGAWSVEVEVNGIKYEANLETKSAMVVHKDSKYEGSLVIPSTILVNDVECSVTSIGEYAFFGCGNLISVVISEGISTFEKDAFSGCNELEDIYCYAVAVPAATYAFEQCPIESFTLHVPASAIEDYRSTEPWNRFRTIVALETTESTYHPLVERGKTWYVHEFNAITNEHDALYYSLSADKNLVVIDGYEYVPMTVRRAAWGEYLERDRAEEERTVGLFREENRRVYFRQSADETEQLVYDFSLNVGDESMFPPLVADEGTMEVTAVGTTVLNGDTLKTISFNKEGEPDWIEGIGYTSSPLAFMPLTPNGEHYVTAYVAGTNFYPLTFSEPYLGWWGTDLTRVKRLDAGKEDYPANDSDSLSYELVPDPVHNGELQLHVSGRMWTHSGPHDYIYCVSEPNDGAEDVNIKIRLLEEPLDYTAQSGLYQVDFFFPRFPMGNYTAVDRQGEHPVAISNDADYRPFIEKGKVWKVGWFASTPEDSLILMQVETHYFDGDTIVGDRLCKKMITKTTIAWDDPAQETHHAVYEEDRHVYKATSDGTFLPLYDFESEKGTLSKSYFDGEGSGTIESKLYVQDEKFHGWITYIKGPYSKTVLGDDVLRWMEGVGYQGFYNCCQRDKEGRERRLISCSVGDEVLYFNPSLANAKTYGTLPGSDVKKHWLDFTHVVKPRPKAPERARGAAVAADAGDENETLKGEYSAEQLFVNFKLLAGPYVITICDDSGTEVYRKEVQTNNVVGINTDISAYAKGRYTINVENSAETFTAEFVIDDETAMRRPVSSRLQAGALYDLSGRQILNHHSSFLKGQASKLERVTRHSSLVTRPSSLPKGVYIKDGRKVVVK